MSRTFDSILGLTVLVVSLGVIAWAFFFLLKRSYDPAKMLFKCAFTIPFVIFCVCFGIKMGLYGPILILIMGIILTIMWTPHIAEMVSKPLTDIFDGGNEPPEPKPYYSIAQTKQKLGKPLEAIVEIRKQLANFPDDYEGVMLLANIQAGDTKDLPSAEITLNHFCDSPDAPPKQVAAALTQMADWHLKIAQDSDSARAVLEKIIARFPDSELSLAAAQRIAHLGGAEKILLAAHDRQRVFVPEGIKSVGLRDSMEDLIPAETDPAKLAADYVKHLEQHPLDTEAREKLAIIYARHYQRLDLAALELAQLINEPNHPPKRVAHWLNLLADLQIHGGADYDAVRETLEKIVESFPDLPVAEMARSRLSRLKLEIKGQKETPNKKLGVYEQNIGLKGDRIYSPRQL
jgi:tetratricopeptide (TPR) repeat protein